MRFGHILALAAVLAGPCSLGAQTLEPSLLHPSVDTMYQVEKGAAGLDTVAVSVQSLRRAARGGVEVWELVYERRTARIAMWDTTWMNVRTLAPLAQRRGADSGGRIEADYDRTRVRTRVTQEKGDSIQERELRFDHPVYAGSQIDVVIRALPLTEGFQTRIPAFIPHSGEILWFHVRAGGVRPVETRGGSVQAWRVEVDTGGLVQILWIARDTRALLRIEGADGEPYLIP